MSGAVDPAGTGLLLSSDRQRQDSGQPQDGEWNLPGEVGSTEFPEGDGPEPQSLLRGQHPPG